MVAYPYAYMTYIVSPLAGLGGGISWRPPLAYSLLFIQQPGRNVGRRMVVARSNYSRTGIERWSNYRSRIELMNIDDVVRVAYESRTVTFWDFRHFIGTLEHVPTSRSVLYTVLNLYCFQQNGLIHADDTIFGVIHRTSRSARLILHLPVLDFQSTRSYAHSV